jgi:hypothetical protein
MAGDPVGSVFVTQNCAVESIGSPSAPPSWLGLGLPLDRDTIDALDHLEMIRHYRLVKNTT